MAITQLIMTEDYLKNTTPIGENVDMKIITPVIDWVQDIYIKPLLGNDLYQEILTQSTPPTSLTPANETLLNDYILKAMKFYVLAECVMTFKFKFTQSGVMVQSSQNGTAIDKAESAVLIDDYRSKGEVYGENLINFIYDNQGDYPAYFTRNGVYQTKPRITAYDSPISFGGKTKRYYYTEIDKRFDDRK